MEKFTIIIILGLACVAAILIWHQISINKSEKKSKKLIEDFIALISTTYSQVEYFDDDPSLNYKIAGEVKQHLYDKTFEHFKNLMYNVSIMPRLEFRYISVDPSKPESVIVKTNRFTAMVFPIVKDLVGLILKYGKKDKSKGMDVSVKIYADRLYQDIEKFVITELRIAQSKRKNQTQN